jgi:polyisoprenoid-binding protein YceI
MRLSFLLLFLVFGVAARAAEAPLDLKSTSITFTGHATLHDFHGAAQDIHGRAQVNEADPNLVTSAVLDIGAARLTTFQDSRDRNMRAWLHVEASPRLEFHLAKITHMSGDPAHATLAQPAFFQVQGDFTLNHETRPLIAQVTGWRDGPLLVIDGGTTIDTTQYGLPIIHQFFLTVDKRVDVKFHLVFDLPPASAGPP